MKYQIITSNTVATMYEVEARSKKEAEQEFYDGDFTGGTDLPAYEIDSQEEIIEVIGNKKEFYKI